MSEDDLLPGKGSYTAVYSREPDGAWIVYVRGHRHEIQSFARSLRTARENIREALSLWCDDAGSATIVDRVELEPALEEELAETEELARLHSVEQWLGARCDAPHSEIWTSLRRWVRSLKRSCGKGRDARSDGRPCGERFDCVFRSVRGRPAFTRRGAG